MEEKSKKRSVGRPKGYIPEKKYGHSTKCKYKPKFCKDLIEWGKTGKTIELFCKEVDIGRKTFYEWVAKYPEFAEARERAQIESQIFYEELNAKAVKDEGGVNFSAVQFNLKTRFGFKEKSEQIVIHKSSLAEYIQEFINLYPEDITPEVAKVLKLMLEREKNRLERLDKGDMSVVMG